MRALAEQEELLALPVGDAIDTGTMKVALVGEVCVCTWHVRAEQEDWYETQVSAGWYHYDVVRTYRYSDALLVHCKRVRAVKRFQCISWQSQQTARAVYESVRRRLSLLNKDAQRRGVPEDGQDTTD
jgi:hypothetical protein